MKRIVFSILIFCIYAQLVTAQTTKSDAKILVSHFLKCWETNDVNTFQSLLHEDVLFAYPGDRLDKAELVEMFSIYQDEKKDIKIYLWDTFIMEGDRFATAYQFAATDTKTDLRQAVGTGVVGRFQDGKIILFKEYYDEEVSTLQYEGKLPLNEGIVTPWPSSIWLRPETID